MCSTFVVRTRLPYRSAVYFQIKELASRSNSIDAAIVGYSAFSSGMKERYPTSPFLLASGDKRHFFVYIGEDALSNQTG